MGGARALARLNLLATPFGCDGLMSCRRPADDRITTMAGEVEAIEDTFADIVAAPADDPGRDSKLKMCARHLRELV